MGALLRQACAVSAKIHESDLLGDALEIDMQYRGIYVLDPVGVKIVVCSFQLINKHRRHLPPRVEGESLRS